MDTEYKTSKTKKNIPSRDKNNNTKRVLKLINNDKKSSSKAKRDLALVRSIDGQDVKRPNAYKTWTAIKCVLFFLLGVASSFYYVCCVLYGGFTLSWIWIWLVFAGFFMVRSFLLILDIRGKLKRVPLFVSIAYRAIFLVGLAIFILVESQVVRTMNTQEKSGLPYVIVLGAGLRGATPTRPLLLRMEKAYVYMCENPDTILIASGGQGPDESMSEGECIRNYLVARGIEENRILVEDRSTNTEENIEYSYQILPEKDAEIGILTSSFHIFRALKIAKMQGHENISGIPARTLPPLGLHYTVREFFGVVKLYL